LELEKRKEDKGIVVSVNGKVDSVTSPELETYLDSVSNENNTHIILDLSGMDYIASAGLRVVIVMAKKLRAKDTDLFLAGLSGPVQKVFQMSGFYSIIKIFDTLDEAMAQI